MLAIAMTAFFAAVAPAQEGTEDFKPQEEVVISDDSDDIEIIISKDSECLEEVVLEDATCEEESIDAIAFGEE